MAEERPAAGAPRDAGRLVEAAAAAAVAGTALLFALLYLFAMAGASLWTDELYGIVHFSARGPWTAWTDYHAPNHILFSLLNALLPGRGSVDPLRARLLSLVAVAALLALVLVFFWRRGRWLAGALAFQLLATNERLLDQTLQARGYGLQLLFAGGAAVALRAYLESGRRIALVAFAALVVLGTFAVPPFLVFGGGLFLLLFLVRRRREVVVFGLLVLAGAFAVHLPVLGSLFRQLTTYRTVGSGALEFASPAAVLESIRLYLLPELFSSPRTAGGAALVLVALVAGLLVAGGASEAETSWRRVLLGAVLLFFGACLLLRSPLVRTTVFVAAPLALFSGALVEDLLRRIGNRGARTAAVALLAVALALSNGIAVSRFEFVPIERWDMTAAFLRRAIPPGTPLWVTFRPELLAPYLPPTTPFAPRFDAELFASGGLAVVDTDVDPPVRFDGRRYAADAKEWRTPLARRGVQSVWFVPRHRVTKASMAAERRASPVPEMTVKRRPSPRRPARSRSKKSSR